MWKPMLMLLLKIFWIKTMMIKMMLIQSRIRMIKTIKRMIDRRCPTLTLERVSNQLLKDLARLKSKKMLNKMTINHKLQFSSHSSNHKWWWVVCQTWWWEVCQIWWWDRCQLTWLLSSRSCTSTKLFSCNSNTCSNFGWTRCNRCRWWVRIHKSQELKVRWELRCQCNPTWCNLECHKVVCGLQVWWMAQTRIRTLTKIEVEISDQQGRLLCNYQLVQTNHIFTVKDLW